MKHEDLLKRLDSISGLDTVQHIYAKNNGGWCGHYIEDIEPESLKQLAADYRRAIEKLELYADPENWVCRCDLFPNIPDYEQIHVCKADYFTGGNPRGKDVAAEFLKSIGEGE